MPEAAARSSRIPWLVLTLGSLPAIAAWQFAPRSVTGSGLAVAGGALLLLAGALLFPLPAGTSRRVSWMLALLSVGLAAVVAELGLPGTVTNDERAYLLQAEIFSELRLAEELPEPACPEGVAHCPLHRRQVYEDPDRGVRFAKYPPGSSLALTPGQWLGFPYGIVLLAGLLALLACAAAARRLDLAEAAWAPALLAASPFFLLVQTSYQSEVYGLPAAIAGYLAVVAIRRGSERLGLLGLGVGAAAGWLFLCRPLTGLVFAAAVTPALLARSGEGAPPRRLAWAWAVLGGLPFLGVALLYNLAQTGSAFSFPYSLYAARFGPFGPDGQVLDVYGNGDVLLGLLRQAGRWSVAGFGILGAAALGLWGLWRLRSRDGGSGLLFALLLPVVYAWHWYPGHWAYLGPLYCFESLAVVTLGGLRLLEDLPVAWRRALPWTALLAGWVGFVFHVQPAADHARWRAAPEIAARSLPPDSVLLLPWFVDPADRERSLKSFTPSRPPWSSECVLVRELPSVAATRAALRELGLEGRRIHRFLPGEGADDFHVQELPR